MLRKEVFGLNRKILVLSFFCYIAILFIMSIYTHEEAYIVFVGLLPLLFYMITFFLLHLFGSLSSAIIWIIPIFYSGLLFLILRTYPVFSFNVPDLAVLNTIFCYIINIFLVAIYKTRNTHDPEKERYKSLFRYYHHLADHRFKQIEQLRLELKMYKDEKATTKENVVQKISSLEDKCKAINAVIGRVYNAGRGGDKKLREKIKIDRDLYNKFSELKGQKSLEVAEIISKILHKLATFEIPESKALNKSIHGNSPSETIIEILARLDKDPILDYYHEAREICVSVLEYYK